MSEEENPSRTPEEREGSTDPALTDPGPEQQDPESGAASEAEADDELDFDKDPARNPADPHLRDIKGG
jgi:type II secretory pathway component PulK